MFPFRFHQAAQNTPLLKGVPQTYGLLLTYAGRKTTVHYAIECCLEIVPDAVQFSYHRKEVFIDEALPEGKVYKLAATLAAAFYPVVIEQQAGSGVTTIANGEAILTRCRKAEVQVRQEYGGALADACLQSFETAWSNPNNILRAFETDFFLQLLFSVLPNRDSPDVMPEISLLPAGVFALSRTGEETTEENKSRYIHFAGTTQNGGSSLSLSYCLYPAGSLFRWVQGVLQYKEADGRSEEVTMELYHINSDEVPQYLKDLPAKRTGDTPVRSMIVSVEEVPVEKKKKGGWSAFFNS